VNLPLTPAAEDKARRLVRRLNLAGGDAQVWLGMLRQMLWKMRSGEKSEIRDYVRIAAPEPEVLRAIGEESQSKGTDTLSSRQIDQVIKTSRTQKPKRG
jgi:hypothetical protein